MDNTESESIRKELEEYEEYSKNAETEYKLIKELEYHQSHNNYVLESIKKEFAEYDPDRMRPKTLMEKNYGESKDLSTLGDAAFVCLKATIRERIEFNELINNTIIKFKDLYRSRSLSANSHNQKWENLIRQLSEKKISLLEFRNNKPTIELNIVNQKMIDAYNLYDLEYEKREQLLRISYECMEISKKYKAALIEDAKQSRNQIFGPNKVANKVLNTDPTLQQSTTFKNKYLKYKEKYLLLKTKLNGY
jgi:superfamily II DNA helicase RecQ